MSDEKNDPFSLDPAAPAPGLENKITMEQANAMAGDLIETASAVLAAAITTSNMPGMALSALRYASLALRDAIIDKQILSEKDVSDAERFAEDAIADDKDKLATNLALREIYQRALRMDNTTLDNVKATLDEAAICLSGMGERGHEDPRTHLVILYAARQMSLRVLKHMYPDPDEYQYALDTVRAMENSIRPAKIDVVTMPANVNMSKGGDA